MLETEIHLFRNSVIPLFRIPRNTASQTNGIICYHTAAFPGKRVVNNIVNKRLQTSIIITLALAPVIF